MEILDSFKKVCCISLSIGVLKCGREIKISDFVAHCLSSNLNSTMTLDKSFNVFLPQFQRNCAYTIGWLRRLNKLIHVHGLEKYLTCSIFLISELLLLLMLLFICIFISLIKVSTIVSNSSLTIFSGNLLDI